MMQVAGGMDRLPAALAARLGNRIVYRAAVREIRQSERGVWVIYADADGRPRRVDADYCVSHDPVAGAERYPEGPLAAGAVGHCRSAATTAPARSDCSSSAGSGNKTTRSTAADRGPTRRSDRSSIHRTASHGAKGVLVGYYLDFRGPCASARPPNVQRLALEQGARVHPQYPTEFETAFSVSWPRVPWSRGSWRSESAAAHEALAALRQPDGRVHFAGDYMTDMSSWMQGAFESAREVAAALHRRALARG